MKFTTAAAAATTLALASASPIAQSSAPADAEIKAGDSFRIMTIRSGSDFQYASVQASTRGLRINQKSQGAFCSKADTNYASFFLTEAGELYLNTIGNPPQQLFVDRSGMGQGIIQYTTGVQGLPKNGERGPFAIQDGNLVFAPTNSGPTGFQACPIQGGEGYSIWLAGSTNPGGNEGCVGFVAKALKEDEPIKCDYTN